MSLALTLCAALAASPASTSQALLDSLREQSGVPGLGAAVWHDGRLAWQGSSGQADLASGRPIDAATAFRLASVSKLFTATAAARLQQAGRLDVDAPLARLLPGEAPAAWGAITPRQLAAHSSGLPHYQLRDALRGGKAHASVAEALAGIGERALSRAPGEAYAYSSWGYTVLSRVVERSGGKPFLELLAETAEVGAEQRHASTQAYEMRGGRAELAPAHDYSYSWGGAGLAATPAALARWGGRLLAEPALLAWMAEPTRLNDASPVRDDEYTVGFGWRQQTALDGGEPLMHHAGAALGARSALALWPSSGSAAALLSNAGWTSFIVNSAQLIAAPFRPRPAGLQALACPVAAKRVSVELAQQRSEPGEAGFRVEAGSCRGRVAAGAALAAMLRDASGRAVESLTLIGLDGDGLGRAALVTPVGLIELRAQADGSLLGRYGARSLRFHLLS